MLNIRISYKLVTWQAAASSPSSSHLPQPLSALLAPLSSLAYDTVRVPASRGQGKRC